MATMFDGYKKMGAAAVAAVGLPAAQMLEALPAETVWPVVVIICAYILGQAINDAAKAWKGDE